MTLDNDKVNKQFKFFSFLSMLYCTLLIVSVLLPYKIINLFGYREPGGIFIFPLTYLLGGAIAETYGRKMALQMVYSSIFCLILFNLIISITIHLPSMPDSQNQKAFLEVFDHGLRLTAGCLVGLLCSDLTNIYRITRLKIIFGGRFFIQRCLWSTAISEGIFNIATYSITYIKIMPYKNILSLMVNSWLLKMLYSLLMIAPLLILMHYLKKYEKIDIYDAQQENSFDFNPQKVALKFLNII